MKHPSDNHARGVASGSKWPKCLICFCAGKSVSFFNNLALTMARFFNGPKSAPRRPGIQKPNKHAPCTLAGDNAQPATLANDELWAQMQETHAHASAKRQNTLSHMPMHARIRVGAKCKLSLKQPVCESLFELLSVKIDRFIACHLAKMPRATWYLIWTDPTRLQGVPREGLQGTHASCPLATNEHPISGCPRGVTAW